MFPTRAVVSKIEDVQKSISTEKLILGFKKIYMGIALNSAELCTCRHLVILSGKLDDSNIHGKQSLVFFLVITRG